MKARLSPVLALLALVCAVNAQDVKTGLAARPAPKAGLTRLDAISQAFDGRIADQKDHLFQDGDYPRIIQILRWQCDLDHKDYELWTDLIWMYGNIEDREDELAVSVEFRQNNLDWSEAWYPEAQVYYLHHDFMKVIPLLETSISLGKPHPNNYRLLAQSWARLGFTYQAIRVWETMLKVYPNDPRAQAQLARAKEQVKNAK